MSGVLDDVTTTSAPVSTAAPRSPGRVGRVLGWVFVAALVIGIALMSMRFVSTAPSRAGALNPDSPGPNGGRAIAELVRDQGTRVDVERSRVDVADALEPGSTLVLTDPVALSDEGVQTLFEGADRIVLLSTSARMMDLLDLGTSAPGAGLTAAGCEVPEFARIGGIETARLFEPAPDVQGCFAIDGAAAVLRGEYQGATVTAVEASRLLSNEHLAENGNAALGLALLAQTDHVVWYVPSFDDSDYIAGGPDRLGDLTPEWVSPAILLLMVAAIAAMVWRGRRFGPLVAESLPVMVRASETMHGRARLTAQAADAPHAASAIRSGTRTRLAARLALSPRATAQEIADAASDRLQVPRGSLYELLDGPAPHDDRDLVDLARRLVELETAVEAARHTERNRP